MPEWKFGISGKAPKDYWATMGYVSVDTLFALFDEEALVNINPTTGEGKNPASKADIASYMKLYEQGKDTPGGGVPPVIVFCPKDKKCFISDGRHRVAAARKIGLKSILTTVIEFHPT